MGGERDVGREWLVNSRQLLVGLGTRGARIVESQAFSLLGKNPQVKPGAKYPSILLRVNDLTVTC